LTLLGLSLLSRIVLVNLGVSTGALYTMTFTHVDGLAVGSCLRRRARSPQLTATRNALAAGRRAAGGDRSGGRAHRRRRRFFWSRQWRPSAIRSPAVLFGAMLVWILADRKTLGLARLFATHFMRQCGKYSYALYVVHVPAASVAFPVGMRTLQRFEPAIGYEGVFLACAALSFVASWTLAVLSWNLFEKRILALKRYFRYEGGARGPEQAVAAVRSAVNMPRG